MSNQSTARCWCCGCVITKGTSTSTLDPNKRLCWRCDGQIQRKAVSRMGGLREAFALSREDWEGAECVK